METTPMMNSSQQTTAQGKLLTMKDFQMLSKQDAEIFLSFKILLILCILVANGFVLVIFAKFKRIRAQPHNVFILALAITDFATGLITIPLDIFKNVVPDFFSPDAPVPWYYRHKEICLFNLYTGIQPLQWSATTLAIIALDRLIATYFPLKYYEIVTRKKAVVAVIIGWIISSVPLYTAIAMSDLDTHDPNKKCTTGRQFHPIAERTIFYIWSAIPVAISFLIYVLIWINVCRHQKQVENQKWQTVTMAIVIVAFTLCLLPLFVVMHRLEGLDRRGFVIFVDVALFLAHSNSFVNVIIYNVFNPSFRRCSRQLLCPGRTDKVDISTVANGNGSVWNHTPNGEIMVDCV